MIDHAKDCFGLAICCLIASLFLPATLKATQVATSPEISAPTIDDFRPLPDFEPGTTVAIQCDVAGRLSVLGNTNQVMGEQSAQQPRVVCHIPVNLTGSPSVLRIQFEPADGSPGIQRLLVLPVARSLAVFRLEAPNDEDNQWRVIELKLKQPIPKTESGSVAKTTPIKNVKAAEPRKQPNAKKQGKPNASDLIVKTPMEVSEQPAVTNSVPNETPPARSQTAAITFNSMASSLGLQLQTLSGASQQQLDIPGGIKITGMTPGSLATRLGFQTGDVIVRVGDMEVRELGQLQKSVFQIQQSRAISANLGLLRPSEGLSLRIRLPLPLKGYRYLSPSGAYKFDIPDGWFLLPNQRNTVEDENFDSVVSSTGQFVIILARKGVYAENEATELMNYHRQKLADAKRFADVSSETLTIDKSPAFRVSYRIPSRRTAISRIAFVHSNARYVINLVSYRVDNTTMPMEITNLLNSINTSAIRSSSAGGKMPKTRPGLGMRIHNVNHELARQLGVRARSGAVVTSLEPRQRAANAGLQVGDVIVGCNDKVVDSIDDLVSLVQQGETNKDIRLDVRRGTQFVRIKVAGNSGPKIHKSAFGTHQSPPYIGVWAISAGTPEATARGFETPLGAILTEIKAGSPASMAGLRVNDRIVRFGKHDVGCFEELEMATLSVPLGMQQPVTFVRGLTRMTTRLKLGKGPATRQTYTDYRHATGIYSLRVPKSWKLQRTSMRPENNINARDTLTSRDGNYQLNCYLKTKSVSNAEQALADSERTMQRELGPGVKTFRVTGLSFPMIVGGVGYAAAPNRRVTLYRVAGVKGDQLFALDCFAPVLSDTSKLPHVLRSIFETIK